MKNRSVQNPRRCCRGFCPGLCGRPEPRVGMLLAEYRLCLALRRGFRGVRWPWTAVSGGMFEKQVRARHSPYTSTKLSLAFRAIQAARGDAAREASPQLRGFDDPAGLAAAPGSCRPRWGRGRHFFSCFCVAQRCRAGCWHSENAANHGDARPQNRTLQSHDLIFHFNPYFSKKTRRKK